MCVNLKGQVSKSIQFSNVGNRKMKNEGEGIVGEVIVEVVEEVYLPFNKITFASLIFAAT